MITFPKKIWFCRNFAIVKAKLGTELLPNWQMDKIN